MYLLLLLWLPAANKWTAITNAIKQSIPHTVTYLYRVDACIVHRNHRTTTKWLIDRMDWIKWNTYTDSFNSNTKKNKTPICDTFPFKWQINSFEITNNMEMCECVCVFGRNSSNCFYCVYNVYVQWLKWDLVLHSFCNICNKLIIERQKKAHMKL